MSLIVQELGWAAAALKSPPAVPLTLAAGAMAYVAFSGHAAPVLAATLAAFILVLQVLIDIRRGLLPHTLNLALGLSGLVLAPIALQVPPADAVLGAPAAFALFCAMAWLSGRVAKRPALGGGDLYLATALGPWLGASGLAPFLLALALASLALLAWRALRSAKNRRFAFGPALALAGWLTLLYQDMYWKCIIYLTN